MPTLSFELISLFFANNRKQWSVEQQTILKNSVFRDVAPCKSCVNRRFGGTYRHHLQDQYGGTSQNTSFFIITAVRT
jgi:hypothetical protein